MPQAGKGLGLVESSLVSFEIAKLCSRQVKVLYWGPS